MTERKNITVEKNKIVIKPLKAKAGSPIIIRKRNKIDLLKGESSGQLSIKNLKFGAASSLYKEDVIFDSNQAEILWDSPMKVTIVNKFNLLTNSSRTIATCIEMQGKMSVKSSDQISKVIGQKNYDTVLAALCSGHLPEEVKAQAILALLKETLFEERGVQTENCNLKMELKEEANDVKVEIESKDICCQTDENCMDLIFKFKHKKRIKRSVLTPYVVKDVPVKIKKKATRNPDNTDNKRIIEDLDKNVKFETKDRLPEPECILPELYLNEASNDTDLVSNISISCDTVALREAENQMLVSVGQRTMNLQCSKILLPDRSTITVPVKPDDDFHIATPDILNNVQPHERTKLLWYQAYIDWRRCLERDADGFLPLHNAVLNQDVDLVKRQCIVLKTKQESLDIIADKMTALQMSIVQDSVECTRTLLQYGADPLYPDEEHRASIHLAGEGSSDQLGAILNHCQNNARDVLLYHEEELWKPEYNIKTNEELGAILVRHMCKMADSQGYTPLMLAAKTGNYTNVKMLIECCPECINAAMPNSGNTALFLATAEACLDAARRSNKSKVADNYHRTITILVENGADPTIPNYAGTNVNDLLAESNNTELSKLFANTLTAVKFFDGAMPPTNFDKFMLVKNEKGNFDLTDLKTKVKKESAKKRTRKSKSDAGKVSVKETKVVKEKPKILENIALPVIKKVIVNPKTVISNVKVINPKEKLVASEKAPESTQVLAKNCVTIVSGIPHRRFITIPFVPSDEIVQNKNPDSKETKVTLPATSTVTGEAGSQAVKRKISCYIGPGKKKGRSK